MRNAQTRKSCWFPDTTGGQSSTLADDREIVEGKWHKHKDSWYAPTLAEKRLKGSHPRDRCYWVGWFLPSFYERKKPNGRSGGSKHSECVNNCDTKPICPTKAYKAVYKISDAGNPRPYALHSPDKNGLCAASLIPGGVLNVFFFPEFRNDDAFPKPERQLTWLHKVRLAIYATLNEIDAGTDKSSRNTKPEHDLPRDEDVDDENGGPSHQVKNNNPNHRIKNGGPSYQVENGGPSHRVKNGGPSHQVKNDGSRQVKTGGPSHQVENDAQIEGEAEVEGNSYYSELPPPPMSPISPDPAQSSAVNSISAEAIADKLLAFTRGPMVQNTKLQASTANAPDPRATPIKTETGAVMSNDTGNLKRPAEFQAGPGQKKQHQLENASRNEQGGPATSETITQVKSEDDADEVMFVRETTRSDNRRISSTENKCEAASDNPALKYILDFVEAGKLYTAAAYPDTSIRGAVLEFFSEHLKSTGWTGLDKLLHTIINYDDRDSRTLVAETLIEKIKRQMKFGKKAAS